MDTNTVQVIQMLSDKIEKGIVIASDKLKIGGDYVYPIMVQQQIIHGFTHIISVIVLIIFGIWAYNIRKDKFILVKKTEGQHGSYPTEYPSIKFLVFIILGISILVTLIHLQCMIGHLINPEYYAIKELISFVK